MRYCSQQQLEEVTSRLTDSFPQQQLTNPMGGQLKNPTGDRGQLKDHPSYEFVHANMWLTDNRVGLTSSSQCITPKTHPHPHPRSRQLKSQREQLKSQLQREQLQLKSFTARRKQLKHREQLKNPTARRKQLKHREQLQNPTARREQLEHHPRCEFVHAKVCWLGGRVKQTSS